MFISLFLRCRSKGAVFTKANENLGVVCVRPMPMRAQARSLSARDGKQSIPATVNPALTESKLELTSIV